MTEDLKNLLQTLEAWGVEARSDDKNFLVGDLLLRAKAAIEGLRSDPTARAAVLLERERCAKLCESMQAQFSIDKETFQSGAVRDAAAAIRKG